MKLRALSVLFVAGMAACSKDPVAVHFKELCYPPTPDTSGLCVYPADCTAALTPGLLHVDLFVTGGTLMSGIQMVNQLPSNEDASSGRTNTNDAIVTEFRMTYSGEGISQSATSQQTETIPAAGSSSPVVIIIPLSAGQDLASTLSSTLTEISVSVRAAGHLVSGTEFVTDEFVFPVYACAGCGYGYSCTAPKLLTGCCPQNGQTAVCACQDPVAAVAVEPGLESLSP